jgi:hypothetical protein
MGWMLPVFQGGSYRAYPMRLVRQDGLPDERNVCSHCLSGACCSSEDPIALNSLDILRLATALDLSPSAFLLSFTQDSFPVSWGPDRYRERIDTPHSSVVTFLRRRSEHPTSPCIFLKYIRDEDGTCRRICSVHAARPLSCREYYYDTCKKRVAGELATMQAEAFEMLRNGRINREEIDERYRELDATRDRPSLARSWQFAFWAEMRRASDITAANEEGAAGFEIADYQDPIDEKVNRMLSKQNVRFEEYYGPIPHDAQLDPFDAGVRFATSPERERLLRLVRTAPRLGLFGSQDFPHYVGLRTLLPGCNLAPNRDGPTVEIGEPSSAVWQIGRGWKFLAALARYADAVHEPPELSPPGTVQLALLEALLPFGASVQRRIIGIELLTTIRLKLAEAVAGHLENRCKAMARRRASLAEWLRLYETVASLDGRAAFPRLQRAVDCVRDRIATHRDRLSGILIRATTRGSTQIWSVRAAESVFSRQAAGRLSLRLLEAAIAHANAAGADPTIALLDTYVRSGRTLCAAARSRVAAMALRCARQVDDDGRWSMETRLRWPALCGRLNIAVPATPGFETGMQAIRTAQAFDGSWGADLVPTDEMSTSQLDYLVDVVRTTSAALEALCTQISGATRRAAAADTNRDPSQEGCHGPVDNQGLLQRCG